METEPILVRPIARIQTDFAGKFGVPRQSGLVPELRGRILFEPAFRSPEAVRGLEEFSHIWLLWHFSAAAPEGETFSPTVRPPRLGGNVRLGVFATRSPFRPNRIGLSCVRLERVEPDTPDGPVLHVLGADLMDGTPILDVKPYLPARSLRRIYDKGSPPGPVRHPAGADGSSAAGPAGRSPGRAGAGPPAFLSERPGPGLRLRLRRTGDPFPGSGRRADGHRYTVIISGNSIPAERHCSLRLFCSNCGGCLK